MEKRTDGASTTRQLVAGRLLPRRPLPSASVARLLLCLCPLLLGGCKSIAYYHQAVKGQIQVLTRREPIPKLLESPGTPVELQRKLKLILEIRSFAQERLHLPVDEQYLSYVDLQRSFAVWNVHAAPEFSLEAKTWWYPIVGRLKYRGYFSESAARDYAAHLASGGFEVYVEGVEAYSTLGWFKDPVMSSFMHRGDVAIAEVLFHELAHQRLFIPSDTDVDEAFATAVAEEGVRRWLESRHQTAAHDDYALAHGRTTLFLELIHQTRNELEALYAFVAGQDLDPQLIERARLEKHRIHQRLRQRYEVLKVQWDGYEGYDAWLGQALNNAQLNTVDSYYRLVPAFRRMLAQTNGDLSEFYRRVESLGDLTKDQRHAFLVRLLE